jgi:hypothetical protein
MHPAIDQSASISITHIYKHSHSPDDGRMSVMEAVAFVTHKDWTDRPPCVCPVVGRTINGHRPGYPAGLLRDIKGDYCRTAHSPEAEAPTWLDFRSLGLTGRALPGRSSSKMTHCGSHGSRLLS